MAVVSSRHVRIASAIRKGSYGRQSRENDGFRVERQWRTHSELCLAARDCEAPSSGELAEQSVGAEPVSVWFSLLSLRLQGNGPF
jgi:hypothetical protein